MLAVVVALTALAPAAWAPEGTESGQAERRVALVIGNGAYPSGPLRNPTNDTRALAAALRALGFEVAAHDNLGQREMRRAILAVERAASRPLPTPAVAGNDTLAA